MEKKISPFQLDDIHSRLSLDPLLDFWEKNLAPKCTHMASMFADLKEQVTGIPELNGERVDVKALKDHHDILAPLMSVIFPTASFESDIMGAITPCTFEPFYVTPEYQRLFLDENDAFKTDVKFFKQACCEETMDEKVTRKLFKIYYLILERIYGITCQQMESMDVYAVPDNTTGLDRYYNVAPDFSFVRIKPLTPVKELTEADRARITDNITDMDVLKEYILLDQFQFSGFTIVRAKDVTESQVISALERDLIDQQSIFSAEGIRRLENRIKVLFQRSELLLAIGALQGDQVMVIKNDCNSNINCLFSNSHHFFLKDLEGSVWLQAVESNGVLRIPDLAQKKDKLPAEEQAVTAGVRSMLLSPLSYQGECIGMLEIYTTKANDLGPVDTLLMEQVTPLFSVALKRGKDELGKHVQSIIKEKCTAVHPSVEWRFERAAIAHMERLRHGDASSEMEPIIFKDVVPFYGQSDIRGSSKARNRGIQNDLTRQLSLARDIMTAAEKERPWPLLREFQYRIDRLSSDIAGGVTSGDETAVFSLLHHELGETFGDLSSISTDVAQKIRQYRAALDPATGMIYDKRKEYEDSVSLLNKNLSAYLEQEDGLIQQTFPHYFEKRQTDGVDYMMYIGASMMESQTLSGFHIKDMTLWQLMMACGLAWHTEQAKPDLKVPLDTCHLILVNHTPLSIRFRFDEKRFDVDGAYDVRHEIIKSRLDKALVKGSGERLTQPGRIAVVYSNPAEGKEIRQHIEFLTSLGKLHDDMEVLDLDDMPDVRGLKAMRVGVDLDAMARGNIIEMKAG